jgi:hypothetical protein
MLRNVGRQAAGSSTSSLRISPVIRLVALEVRRCDRSDDAQPDT